MSLLAHPAEDVITFYKSGYTIGEELMRIDLNCDPDPDAEEPTNPLHGVQDTTLGGPMEDEDPQMFVMRTLTQALQKMTMGILTLGKGMEKQTQVLVDSGKKPVIPKFTVIYSEYQAFIERFEALVEKNQQIPTIGKLQILLDALEGEPKRVRHFKFDVSSYEQDVCE